MVLDIIHSRKVLDCHNLASVGISSDSMFGPHVTHARDAARHHHMQFFFCSAPFPSPNRISVMQLDVSIVDWISLMVGG